MRLIFLSDLHLHDGRDPAATRLEKFLRTELSATDVLVLGGDIFDLFVGNKAVFRERFSAVIGALTDLGRGGATIYYLEGNHDFHLDGVFPRGSGVNVVTDAFSLNVLDRDIWVAHGDLIDPEDRGYRFLRWFTRLWWMRLLVRVLPGKWIDGIGRRSSRESRKYNNTEKVDQPNRQRLRDLYLEYAKVKIKNGYRHVLVGHSHLRDQVPSGGGEYLNLGFSGDALVYGLLSPGSEFFEIRQFS